MSEIILHKYCGYAHYFNCISQTVLYLHTGMIGFDGGGWLRTASREAPTSLNQRNT